MIKYSKQIQIENGDDTMTQKCLEMFEIIP